MLLSFVRSSRAAVLLGLAVIWACGSVSAQTTSPEPYRLQPGDTLLVSVLEDPELDREVLILPDGRISLPIAGTLMAAGRTPGELESRVRSKLQRNFVQPPSVTVTVTALAPEDEDDEVLSEVFVLGEVASPGRFEYDPKEPISVLKALSLAGGVGPFAARSRIQVRETVDGTEILRLFDYDSVEEGLLNSSADLRALQDAAVIIVPERGLFE